jgi:hypothetical protein
VTAPIQSPEQLPRFALGQGRDRAALVLLGLPVLTADDFWLAIDDVTREELQEALQGPSGEDEREGVLTLLRWFTRRYPTGEERLAYARQASRRWHVAHQKVR